MEVLREAAAWAPEVRVRSEGGAGRVARYNRTGAGSAGVRGHRYDKRPDRVGGADGHYDARQRAVVSRFREDVGDVVVRGVFRASSWDRRRFSTLIGIMFTARR